MAAATFTSFVDNFRTQLAKDAEMHLSTIFPQRLQTIIDVLKSPLFDLTLNRQKLHDAALTPIPSDVCGKDASLPRSSIEVSTNPIISEAYNVVKPFLLQLGEDAQLLRMWVVLSIPKIEDGNNFGVSVQEEVMVDASRTETDVTSMLDFYCDYLIYRGKINTKRIKWPGIRAYTEALVELDEMTYIRIRMTLQDIRNNYARLYDLYMKNISKIRDPRSDSGINAVNIMY
ncbi:unnamed protein product [Hydatigera taeniaeformis]|uniref:Proteasome activator complex subunit 3 n=1 Tax=Hydatigena taeniaeformis TaxID=6205 RepID=A0A0R3WTP4_HYDTA|nr:unnamed protein product [Hydatigera taeniaeformis]